MGAIRTGSVSDAKGSRRLAVAQRRLLTRAEALEELRIGRDLFDHLVKSRQLAVVRIGRRVFVAPADIDAYIKRATVAARPVSALKEVTSPKTQKSTTGRLIDIGSVLAHAGKQNGS